MEIVHIAFTYDPVAKDKTYDLAAREAGRCPL